MAYSIEDIKKIAQIVSEMNLGKISVKDGNSEITVEGRIMMPAPPHFPETAVALMPEIHSEISLSPDTDVKSDEKISGNIVKSPIVGTFYSSPAPDKPPFVQVGSTVKKGDVIMIIESMKLMNEVTSEFDGTVKKIMVKNGEAVEYDQPVMIIEQE
jgi:acetyl-CoA carboxylase biotin carboxyl carrier protein